MRKFTERGIDYMIRKVIRMISCTFILCAVISAIGMTVYALDWDGSSTGGGGAGSPAGPNGYAIRTTGDNCLGYRFSVVDKYGNTKNGAVIDVFRNTTYGNSEYSNAYKYNTKYNKIQNIQNQNNSFGSSKNSWDCYKEANMGFAQSLPTPDGMNSWQNDGRNLNSILSILGIGNISNLKNGDKVLVEPLFDVRLQGVYHSLTVTEIALYGKWLLGANSNGGSSSTSASWGFISSYTNRYYPNSLYTPDGQGLWSGVGAIGSSSRATFYTIINSGYGVGIAYTETKPDFTPVLSVNICEAWRGGKSDRSFYYGNSNGSSFGNYSYANGYPIKGDSVWFAVNFPAESENTYVRQSVRLSGGSWTSRNCYSNNNTWWDMALSPTIVDANRSSYIVEAKVDWIDGNGNILKYGAVKTFYIPVRPKINPYQVTLTDIAGKTAAYGSSSGYSGKVYVGQRVYPKYIFTSENTWTSYNNFTGNLYTYFYIIWLKANGVSDMTANGIGINQNASYSKYSSLYPYRVPDNSAGGNRIRFNLTSAWYSDTGHTSQNAWIDIPTVKADVELYDIRLIDAHGNYITDREIYAYQTVTPQYIYKNNTSCTVYVEGYNNDNTQINGIYAIPAGGTIAVNGKSITVPYESTFSVWGGVYLEGAGRTNTSWESDGSNNQWLRYWYVKHPLTIEAITPNSYYREGIDVITSFKVKNAAIADFIPNNNISVKFTVSNGSTILYTETKTNIVIPSENENLVYFKWTVPRYLYGVYITVKGEVYDNDVKIDTGQISVKSTTVTDSQTHDTQYESSKPSGWSAFSVPSAYSNSATWSEWVFSNGSFTKKTYGIMIANYPITITPDTDSPSASQINGIWNVKSGYGFTLQGTPVRQSVSGTLYPSSSAYTYVQNGYMMFPEYNYSAVSGRYRTLESSYGTFRFAINPAANNKRIHFIPLWYPNGTQNYTASCNFYDFWTPAGMLSARLNTNSFTINGSLYDDHFIGRK